MIFNGHTLESVNSLDEVVMTQIQTMYADGIIGNQSTIALLGKLANGIFNYIRPASSNTYSLSQIIGSAYDYIYPPLTKQEREYQSNEALLAFLSQAPGFNMERMKAKNGK